MNMTLNVINCTTVSLKKKTAELISFQELMYALDPSQNRVWVGARSNSGLDDMQWVHSGIQLPTPGSELPSYIVWDVNEPNNDCVAIRISDSSFRGVQCDSAFLHYICEFTA